MHPNDTLGILAGLSLIPVSALAFREKASVREILGAVLAVAGVALLAW
jgi:drug/metabolite transporter (DMT)-like permease